jgi:hypothetical protein
VTFAATAGGVILATLWMATLLRGDAAPASSYVEQQPELEVEGHPIAISADDGGAR